MTSSKLEGDSGSELEGDFGSKLEGDSGSYVITVTVSVIMVTVSVNLSTDIILLTVLNGLSLNTCLPILDLSSMTVSNGGNVRLMGCNGVAWIYGQLAGGRCNGVAWIYGQLAGGRCNSVAWIYGQLAGGQSVMGICAFCNMSNFFYVTV